MIQVLPDQLVQQERLAQLVPLEQQVRSLQFLVQQALLVQLEVLAHSLQFLDLQVQLDHKETRDLLAQQELKVMLVTLVLQVRLDLQVLQD